jgi:hypothetical protein
MPVHIVTTLVVFPFQQRSRSLYEAFMEDVMPQTFTASMASVQAEATPDSQCV